SILGRPQFTIHNSPFIIHNSHSLGQSERGPRGITYQLPLADIADVPSLGTELHDPLSLTSQVRPARSRSRVLLDPGNAVRAVIKAHRAQPFPAGPFDTAALSFQLDERLLVGQRLLPDRDQSFPKGHRIGVLQYFSRQFSVVSKSSAPVLTEN